MKNIVILDHVAELSGAEIYLLTILSHIDKSKFKFIFISTYYGPLIEEIKKLSVETIIVPLSKKTVEYRRYNKNLFTALKNCYLFLIYSFKINKILKTKNIKVDKIYAYSIKAFLYGCLLKMFIKKKLIWHFHDRIDERYFSRIHCKVLIFCANIFADFIICNSNSSLNSIIDYGGNVKKAKRIYYGIDLEKFETDEVIKSKWFCNNEKNVIDIGLIGRIMRWKGQDVFIEAIKIIENKKINVKEIASLSLTLLNKHFNNEIKEQIKEFKLRYYIIGDALFGEEDYKNELLEKVKEYELEDKIIFTGFIKNTPELLSSLDIIVHTSIIPEPFGIVLIEAMSKRKPVIATDCGGPKEIIINDLTGYLVPPSNPEILAEKILLLASNNTKIKQMGENGYHRVQNLFDIKNIIKELEEVLFI